MKLRFSSFHVPAPFSNHAHRSRRLICAAWLLAASMAGPSQPAGAAPKGTPTATPTPTPTATLTPAPTVVPAATATPNPAATPTYSGTQQMQYIATARDAFIAQRTSKSQPFLDAHKALDASGGLSAKGLKSKADIAARRDLIAKTLAANDEYLAFVNTQEDTYRAELAKTPLIPNEFDPLIKDFTNHTNGPTIIKLREDERDVLKIGDDTLAFLDKKFGAWTVNDSGRITFKKAADANAYGKMIAGESAKVAEIDKLRAEAVATPSPSPSASPGISPAGATPAASPSASVSAAPSATAKP